MIRYNTPAIIIARQDEALTHGQVMYGLIKPTKDMEQIESTAAMVNVIPKKRIYRMETADELDLFINELIKRPLVLQPSAHIGRGVAMINCAFYTREEKWILLLNQIHGKIRSKLDIGVQMARSKMEHGEPFTLTISLNEYLKRIYLDYLTKAVLNPRFTFVEFTDAEIVIRYHGARGTSMRGKETRLTFDDLLPGETKRRGVTEAQSEWRNPALRVVMPDELNRHLPGWGFEQGDPFANIGDSEDDLDEGATGGVDIQQEMERLMPPGASRYAGGTDEVVPATGRVMGRAQRKANQNKYQVPVELHLPEQGGPQILDGNAATSWEKPPPHYEDLHTDRQRNEHPYEEKQFHGTGAPRSPHSPSNVAELYKETGFNSPNHNSVPSAAHRSVSPSSPRISQSVQNRNQTDRYSQDNLRSPRTPTSPHIDQSRSRRTPTRDQSRSPHTPTSPHYDRYNTEPVNTYRQPQQTYLTDDNNDDEDGGFSTQSPRSRTHPHMENKYNSDYNRNTETSRYGNGQYAPNDRYASPSSPRNIHQMSRQEPSHVSHNNTSVQSSRGNFRPSNRPTPSPRGLHHHQGSGRSDTTTSDSGFDDYDSSRPKDKYSDPYIGKAPFYNRGFEKDMSPEKDTNINDILAQHKAMAASMLHQGKSVSNSGGHHGDSGHGYHSDNMYGREIQKLRRNINDLEEACDKTSVGYSHTANHSNFAEQEHVSESFI